MKIDVHVHITPPDIIRNYKKIGEKEPYFRLLSETPHNRFATYEQVAEHLQENHFDKGIVFGFGFQDMGLCRYVNDYTMEAIRQYPDLLIGYMVVPARHKDLEKEVERAYLGGLRGVGELFPEGQNMEIATLHETAFKDCLLHYQLPLLLHTNETVGHYYPGKTKVAMHEVETFIRHHQELTIILAHFGGGLLFFELMKELRAAFANVYYDTAAGVFLYDKEIYNVAREIGILNKILFGTDYPLLPISRYDESLSVLSDKERAMVMGENAKKILRF
ncbi:amidohydrolase [Clostridiales bacterium COT073_COT-073]|nr:amidohydrolase [Clostridiales bacterium COT073_COT-073]